MCLCAFRADFKRSAEMILIWFGVTIFCSASFLCFVKKTSILRATGHALGQMEKHFLADLYE